MEISLAFASYPPSTPPPHTLTPSPELVYAHWKKKKSQVREPGSYLHDAPLLLIPQVLSAD